MDGKENLKSVVAANLRSVTQSCKGGVPIERLERDYRDLLGTPIPYRDMGYSSLEAMIHSMPDVIKMIRNNSGQTVVIGVADGTTAHIVSLVSRQKDTKSKKFMTQSRRPHRMQTNRHPPQYSKRYKIQPWLKPAYVPPQPVLHRISPVPQKATKFINQKYIPPCRRDLSVKSSFEMPPRFRKFQATDNSKITNSSPERNFLDGDQQSCVILPVSYTKSPDISEPTLNPTAILGVEDSLTQSNIRSPKPRQIKPKRTVTFPSPPLPTQLSAKEFVAEYALMQNLEPLYQTHKMGQRRKTYICTLTLGGKKYHSFPVDKPTVSEAEEEAASHAKRDIESEALKTKYAAAPIDTPEDIAKLMGRIEEIVAEKPNGIWSIGVPKEFETKCKQTLPDSWLTLVQQYLSNVIEFEVPDRLNLPKDACILRILKTPSGTTTPTSSSSRLSNPLDDELVSELNQQTLNVAHQVAQDLTVPGENQWPVIVTSVSSTVNIAVRLLDHTDGFIIFSEQMATFYQMHSIPVQRAVNSKLYIAHLMDDGCSYWHRVCVEEVIPDSNEVVCYFVDVGDKEKISISDLQEIDPRFEAFAFQAVCLRLSGLEDWADIVKFENLVSYLLDKTFIAEIVRRDGNGIEAILYDTSGDDDVNLNQLLRETTIRESLISDLPQVGSTAICYLTYVTPDGDIYLRMCDPCHSLLECELEKLTPKFEQTAATKVLTSSVEQKMYVSKYIDGIWYRTLLIGTSDATPDEVEVFYVDYGNTSWVSLRDMCELEPISKFLVSLPYQAMPCLLNDVPPIPSLCWSEEAINKLYELAGDNEELIVKVEHPATNDTPAKVSLYKRNEYSQIISINQTLAFSTDLFRQEQNVLPALSFAIKPSSLSLPLEKDLHSSPLSSCIPDVAVPAAEIEVQMAKLQNNQAQSLLWTPTPEAGSELLSQENNLPPQAPNIPDVGQYFDVYITLVASPSNFVVQPMESAKELSNLLNEMHQFYSVEENICEMHSCLLKEENCYAALHNDTWYRVRVKSISQDDPIMATVHFVDFGDFVMLEMSKLQPLYKTFTGLPCQAIKASLAGVKPFSEDWTVEQCIAFQKQVTEKSFVSIIHRNNVSKGSDFQKSFVELFLVDTSLPDKDVYVHKQLIEDKLALPA